MAEPILYEIINPSDPYTFEAPDVVTAAAALAMLGDGKYGGTCLSPGGEDIPFFMFGGYQEWFKARGVDDLSDFIGRHRAEIAATLESVVWGHERDRAVFTETIAMLQGGFTRDHFRELWADRRSSMNDIGGLAAALAKRCRLLAADGSEASRG